MPEAIETEIAETEIAGIPQLWEEAEQLKVKIQDLQTQLEKLTLDVYSMNDLRCEDDIKLLRRVRDLENRSASTKKTENRLSELEHFLLSKQGYRASFEEIRGHLNIKPNQFSALLKALKCSNPSAVEILRSSNHKKKILVWKRSFQIEVK